MNSEKLFPDDPEYADASLNAATREHTEALWAKYRTHAEPDFPSLLRADFIERFTEMFVACHLLDLGWKVCRAKGAGPDFWVEASSGAFEVEVTAPERGRGRGGVVPLVCDGVARELRADEMDFRFMNAIALKERQLRGSGKREPLVLFVNMVRAQHAWLSQEPPMPLLALLGIDEMEGVTSDGLSFARGQFRRSEYSWLSAVVAARVTAWSAARCCHDVAVMHNPRATARMPEGVWGTERVREYTIRECQRILDGTTR